MNSGRDAVIVGIDAGGSYVKATAFDLGAGTSSTSSRQVPVVHPRPGLNERDAEELWRRTAAVVREALAGLRDGSRRVAAVVVTAHGNGAYLVDSAGRPVRAAVQASDTRASSLVEAWKLDGVEDALRSEVWNGLWAGQPGPILAWLQKHEPDTLADAATLVMCGDYLRGRLSGRLTAELTAWSCNGLVDSARGQVSERALAAFGIEEQRRLIPNLVAPSSMVGEVSREAALATGLLEGVAVVAGTVDNVALHIGAGVLNADRIVVGAGTWSINQLLVPASEMVMDGQLGAVEPSAACVAVPAGLALLIEASATSASALGWAVDSVLRGIDATAQDAGADVFTHALARIADRPRRSDAPMFVPHLDGSRDNAGARGAWIGLSSADDDIDLAGAVVEGICFEHRRHIDRLSRAQSRRLPLRLAGGAGRSRFWAQTFADVTGRDVEVSPVQEIGAVGAALVGGTTVGAFKDLQAGVQALNPTHERFVPRAESVGVEGERFDRYLRFSEALDALEQNGPT